MLRLSNGCWLGVDNVVPLDTAAINFVISQILTTQMKTDLLFLAKWIGAYLGSQHQPLWKELCQPEEEQIFLAPPFFNCL